MRKTIGYALIMVGVIVGIAMITLSVHHPYLNGGGLIGLGIGILILK